MAFFGKKHNQDPEAVQASKKAISSIVSSEMQITGEIKFQGKARIDGLVSGNVKGEHLVLSESGKIIGDIEVQSLVCHGTIEGNIHAKLVTALETASINGKLIAVDLAVQSGAVLDGEIKAARKEEKSEKKSTAVTPLKAKAQEDVGKAA